MVNQTNPTPPCPHPRRRRRLSQEDRKIMKMIPTVSLIRKKRVVLSMVHAMKSTLSGVKTINQAVDRLMSIRMAMEVTCVLGLEERFPLLTDDQKNRLYKIILST